MTARLKVDEDLPPQVAEILIAHGHDAKTVVAQGWRGYRDCAVREGVQRERRWLVTGDKGFATFVFILPGAIPASYFYGRKKKAVALTCYSRRRLLSLISIRTRALRS